MSSNINFKIKKGGYGYTIKKTKHTVGIVNVIYTTRIKDVTVVIECHMTSLLE